MLQGAVVGVDMAKVCPECWRDLSHRNGSVAAPKVPKNSLVRVDTGKVPAHLQLLTAIEAKLVAPYRYSRDLYLMKPEGRQDRPNAAYQKCWTGHVLAYPQACGQQLSAVFPADPAEAAASINVVFLSGPTDGSDIPTMANSSPALKVCAVWPTPVVRLFSSMWCHTSCKYGPSVFPFICGQKDHGAA